MEPIWRRGQGYSKINEHMKMQQKNANVKNPNNKTSFCFEMWGDCLTTRRAQRLGDYGGFMNKCDKQLYIKHSTKKSRRNIKWTNLHPPKMIFQKPLGPNGMVITMVSWKPGSRQGRPNQEQITAKLYTLGEKVVRRVPFWKSWKPNMAPKSNFVE